VLRLGRHLLGAAARYLPAAARRKLDALDEAFEGGAPAAILSANIGCITHLQAGTAVPVRHWVEVLDEALV
jgi:glycolate oxidase iron-sulfur subunit